MPRKKYVYTPETYFKLAKMEFLQPFYQFAQNENDFEGNPVRFCDIRKV